MQEIKSIQDADVSGKRVLVRVDFDVPMKDGAVADDSRLKSAVPTIQYLHEHGASKIILMGHLGRPNGKKDETFSLAPVEARLKELVSYPEIEVLDNLRFDPGEEKNDEAFAKSLAEKADIYVNEAFAVSHREHASIVGVPKLLSHFAGIHFMEEVEHLSKALVPPQESYAIIAGAKFETKEPLLKSLSPKYKKIFLGGVLANDILKSRGLPIGSSMVSDTGVPTELATDEKIIQPDDVVVAEKNAPASQSRPALTNDVRADEWIYDIGPKTAEAWSKEIGQAQFVLWNGPTGVYENGYTAGTDALAQALVQGNAAAVLGGGDTAAAVSKFSFDAKRIFISTGGGAMLQFLADGTLLGIEALKH